jgi:hypothetical protein
MLPPCQSVNTAAIFTLSPFSFDATLVFADYAEGAADATH